jgi:hypothetical protein
MATAQLFEVTFKFHALQVYSTENGQVRYTAILLFMCYRGECCFLHWRKVSLPAEGVQSVYTVMS